jgi:hypothetical protein
MSAAQEVCRHLAAIGATIEQAGDRLLLRAGPKPVPADIIRRVREAKADLLILLRQTSGLTFARVIDTKGEPGLEQPCAARRGRVQELDRTFLHFCVDCGRFASFGYGVHLRLRPLWALVLRRAPTGRPIVTRCPPIKVGRVVPAWELSR